MVKVLVAWLMLIVVIVFSILIWASINVILEGGITAVLSVIGLFIMYNVIVEFLARKFKEI